MQAPNNVKQIRRLQLVGGSTYVISLPKAWVEDMDLKSGAYLSLLKNPNNSVTLFQDESRKVNAVAVIAKADSEESIRRKIIAIYLSGYSVIEIGTKGMAIPSSHRAAIRSLVQTTLMGTEIIEASSERMVLQVLTHLAQLSFDVALRRMHATAANMHRDAMHAMKGRDLGYADEVAKMDDEVDRFSLYMMRNLNLALENVQTLIDSGLEKQSECLEYRTIVKCVERIADHATLIAKKVKYLKSAVDRRLFREIESLSSESLAAFENSMTALAERDYAMAEKVASDVSRLNGKIKVEMDSLRQSGNVTILKLVLEDIRRTQSTPATLPR